MWNNSLSEIEIQFPCNCLCYIYCIYVHMCMYGRVTVLEINFRNLSYWHKIWNYGWRQFKDLQLIVHTRQTAERSILTYACCLWTRDNRWFSLLSASPDLSQNNKHRWRCCATYKNNKQGLAIFQTKLSSPTRHISHSKTA